jgi:hypothetical protein
LSIDSLQFDAEVFASLEAGGAAFLSDRVKDINTGLSPKWAVRELLKAHPPNKSP